MAAGRQQVFFIHGGGAYTKYEDFLYDLEHEELWSASNTEPSQKWSKNLRADLGDGYEVFTPTMPNSANAKYVEWKIWFERHFEYLHDDIVLVGWSLGGSFLTRYLTEEKFPFKIKALFLLAAPYDHFVSEGREDGGDFYPDPTKLDILAKTVSNIYILHSEDDFVVPYTHAEKYVKALPEATLVSFTDKNHFLVPELPELVGRIKELG